MKDIKLVENVQRRATKFIVNDFSMDYKSRLLQLKLLPLSMPGPSEAGWLGRPEPPCLQ